MDEDRKSAVLADQVKRLNWCARKAQPKGRITDLELAQVRAKAIALISRKQAIRQNSNAEASSAPCPIAPNPISDAVTFDMAVYRTTIGSGSGMDRQGVSRYDRQ